MSGFVLTKNETRKTPSAQTRHRLYFYSNLSEFSINGWSPLVIITFAFGDVDNLLNASIALKRINKGVSPSAIIFCESLCLLCVTL